MGKFNFKPFDKVLVRAEKENHWDIDFFGRFDEEHEHHYVGTAGCCYVECIPYNNETAHLLGTTDDYQEPYEPKDGDFVVCEKEEEGPKSIFIFKGWNGDRVKMYCIRFYSDLRPIVGLDEREFSSDKGFLRKATDSETSDFLSKLHEIGKDWDAEKKEIVEYRWKPEDGEDYWLIDTDGGVSIYAYEEEYKPDRTRLEIGNCFRTREEAQTMAGKFKELLKKD